jgi:glyoxylase-like metal-dependent hydrolase (beta-lactamase superfamily II)
MISGNYQIEAIETGIFALDGGAMFGVVPKVLWSKSYHVGDELNRIPLAARINTGNGTKYDDSFARRFNIDRTSSDITCSLAKFGLTTSDITDVIITHLHFDHAGGATAIKDGKICPTFENAKYYVQREHLQWAKSPKDKDKASFIEEDFVPIIENGQLIELDGETEISNGITVFPVYGHTKAMQLVKIDTGSEIFMYMADLCPTADHIPFPYVMGYDNFPLTTIEEKKKILPDLFEENAILIYEHDAFRQASRIQNHKSGYIKGEDIILTEYK